MTKVTTNRRPLDKLIAGLGDIVKDVQDETVDETAMLMRQRVHVISGQTRGSIETNHAAGTVTADFGAVFEMMKGGSHDFVTPSYTEALGHAADKVTRRLRRVTGG